MTTMFVALIAALAMTSCTASSIREKRQAGEYGAILPNFQCPGNGPFPDTDDCSSYVQCDNGVGTRMSCSEGLEFNPERRYCDFPNNVINNNCRRTSQASPANALCQNAGNPEGYISHPNYCNAFLRCGNGFLYPGCTFCAEGQYFDGQTGRCTTYRGDYQQVCGGRGMVAPVDQEFSRLDASCRPGRPDLFAPLREKILNGGGLVNPTYYPGNNNNNPTYYPANNNNVYPTGPVYPQQGEYPGY